MSKLDRIADAMQIAIGKSSKHAFERLLEELANGTPIKQALLIVSGLFKSETVEAMAKAFTDALGTKFSRSDVLDMVIDGKSMNHRLSLAIQEPTTAALIVWNNHKDGIAKVIDAGLAAFKTGEIVVPKDLPYTLKATVEIKESIAKWIENGAATKVKTPALQAAYKAAGAAMIDRTAESALNKQLEIAYGERIRYQGNRLAQDQLFRKHHETHAERVMSDENIKWVEVRKSDNHPKTDICDYHAGLNAFGMGPGIYKKGKAPLPPFHPHCRCRIIERMDIVGDGKPSKLASRNFFNSLSDEDKKSISGSASRLEELKKTPERLVSVLDSGKKDEFKTRYIGDV